MRNMKCAELLYISACSAASHSGIPFDRIYFYYYLLSKALYYVKLLMASIICVLLIYIKSHVPL